VTSTVVIQTKQGIGDVIWHLPFIRAIATASGEDAVTFLTLPSTHARDLLQAEPSVAQTLYFENRGSELERGLHILRLISMLRRLRCETVWILDRTARPAFCALMAGVRSRIGVGLGRQRFFITNGGIDPGLAHAPPIEWLSALMATMGIECSTEPNLRLPTKVVDAIGERYHQHPPPRVVVALGGSHPAKDWPAQHWMQFISGLRARMSGTLFVIGGPDHAAQAQHLIAVTQGAPTVNACDLTILEAAALMRNADLFIGPDSGPMNIAAAVGIPSFGLFGATRVLTYSKFINPILPDDGGPATLDGMRRISPGQVLERIAPYLIGAVNKDASGEGGEAIRRPPSSGPTESDRDQSPARRA
jgi:heptosyltransferase II